jgi:GNAT superfamily N-acetyltransferase
VDEVIELTRLGNLAAVSMVADGPRLVTRFARNSALVLTDEHVPGLNRLAIGPEEDPIRLLGEWAEIANERGHPWRATFTSHVAAALAPQAERLGLTPLGETRLMVLRPEAALMASCDYTIERSTGPQAVEAMAALLSRSLDPSSGFPADALMRAFHGTSGGESGIFIGSRDGLPMSTVTAIRTGETVGIWRMATAREFQRKGVRRALLARVINLYWILGATRFYLRASEAGSGPARRAALSTKASDSRRSDITPSGSSDAEASGGYLAQIGHCTLCHTPIGLDGQPDYANRLGAGGRRPWRCRCPVIISRT